MKSEGAMEGQKMGKNIRKKHMREGFSLESRMYRYRAGNFSACFEVVETHLQLRRGMRGGVTCLKHIPLKSYVFYLFSVC